MGTTNTLDLNNRVNALEKAVSGGDSAQANKADIATEFSATTNYTAGCFVYHGGKLYQFNADHSAGAWDPTDAVEANVTDQVVSNAAAIAGLAATDVAYDNTASGLTATDVQGAVDEVKDALDKIVVNSCTLTYYDANSLRGAATIPAGFAIEDAFISAPRYDDYTAKGRLFTYVAASGTIVLLGSNFASGDTVTVKVAWMKA